MFIVRVMPMVLVADTTVASALTDAPPLLPVCRLWKAWISNLSIVLGIPRGTLSRVSKCVEVSVISLNLRVKLTTGKIALKLK